MPLQQLRVRLVLDLRGEYQLPAVKRRVRLSVLVLLPQPCADFDPIVGLTRGTGKPHIIRATLEAIAYQVKDVVDINDLIASFETSSQAWPLIIDQEAKSVVISAYIDQYRKQGIGINKSSVYYAELIDAMTQQSADMLNQPLKQVLKILAILEYDFNNGQNKDDLALKILGNQQAVMQNKKRLGL